MSYGEHEGTRRVSYDGGDEGIATFITVHEDCGLFVKADDNVQVNGLGELRDAPNATCKRHGRVEMIFEGFFGEEDFA